MPALLQYATAFATFLVTASALNGIVAPSNITADTDFEITFENANNDTYRVFLAASLSGSNGPTCYLLNTTHPLTSPLTLSIPPSIGPPASYYSIALSSLTTTPQDPIYSNPFTLSNATGNYTAYENALHGSPFWSAKDLPCEAYSCARECAMQYYPEDLVEVEAYGRMRECILGCEGVTPEAGGQTGPANAAAATDATATATGDDAAAAASTSDSAASRNVVFVGAAAAGFGALAFLL